MNHKGSDCALTPLRSQNDGSGLRIHREMHDDGAIGPLSDAGEMSAERHLVIGSLRCAKTLTEENHLRPDRPTERIDPNTRNQFQWNSVAHLILDRRATRSVRQGIGRGQSNHHITRHSIGGNLDFDDVVLPSTRPDDHTPDRDIVDSEHRIWVAGTSGSAEMRAGNLYGMAGFDLRRCHRSNCCLLYTSDAAD